MPDLGEKTGSSGSRLRESEKIIRAMRGEDVQRMDTDTFIPYGPTGLKEEPSPGIPTTLNELAESVTRSYDLSVTSAGTLNVPSSALSREVSAAVWLS